MMCSSLLSFGIVMYVFIPGFRCILLWGLWRYSFILLGSIVKTLITILLEQSARCFYIKPVVVIFISSYRSMLLDNAVVIFDRCL